MSLTLRNDLSVFLCDLKYVLKGLPTDNQILELNRKRQPLPLRKQNYCLTDVVCKRYEIYIIKNTQIMIAFQRPKQVIVGFLFNAA